MIILFNNKFVSKTSAKISMLSESLMYGFGVFETLRADNKTPHQAKEHIARLKKSAKEINLKLKYNSNEITKMLEKVVSKSPHKSQKVKIVAIKEGILVTSEKLHINPKIYEGVSLKSVNCTRSLPKVKAISYLSSYISHEKAAKAGFYDALLINDKGEVTEGAYCNIFWFEGETLCTTKDNVLEGITRKTVLKKSLSKTALKNITLKELVKKNEIFLTQSTKGIVPVTKIDGYKIGTGSPGKNSLKLISKIRPLAPQSRNLSVKLSTT